MSKKFRDNEKTMVKNLCRIQEAIVILAGNIEYWGYMQPSKLNYKYIIPTYIYDPNRFTGLTSVNVKPTRVKIISKWEGDYSVANYSNKYTEYNGKTYSTNYLFITSDLYLDDICSITEFLTKLRTKKIKVKDIRPMYNALVKDMYTKYDLNRFTGIDIKYRGINDRPYEKDNLVVKLLTVDDDVPKKDNKEYVKEEDYYYVHITKIIPKIKGIK